MITLSTLFELTIPPLLTGAGGPLHTAKCGLFAASITPNYSTTYVALTTSPYLPTFTGYAEASLTWASIFSNTDGSIQLYSALVEFSAPSDATNQTIYGYYVSDGGTPEHICWTEVFPTPIVQGNAPRAIALQVNYQVSPGNNNGSVVVVSS